MKLPYHKIELLLEKGETYPIGFWAFILNLLVVIFMRAFLEGLLERPHLIGLSRTAALSQAAFFRHFPLFFLLSFLIVLIVLRLFTGENVERIAKISLLAFPIILIPPLADIVFTWGEGGRLYYIESAKEYRLMMLGFFFPGRSVPGASYGLRIEIVILLALAGAYVLIKTKNPVKALGAMLLAFGILGSLGSIPFLSTAIVNGTSSFFGKDPLTTQNIFKGSHCLIADRAHRIEAILFLLLAVSCVFFMRIWKPRLLSSILEDFRWSRFLHYFIVASFGLGVGYLHIGRGFFDVLHPINHVVLLVWLFALVFVFESATLLNDLHDTESDAINSPHRPIVSGRMSAEEGRAAVYVFLALALVSSSILGLHQFVLIGVMWIASYLYSTKPFRLKKRFLLSALVIGFESVLCFMYGYALFGQIFSPRILPWKAAGVIFMYSFFCASIKDIKDYEGDRLTGSRTLVTVLGRPSVANSSDVLCFSLLFLLRGFWESTY